MKMKQTDRLEKLLNWLDKEKLKDTKELEKNKYNFISEIKGLNKEDIFRKQIVETKLTLWQRIRKTIWGY
jgi:hypothetical protein